MRIVDSCFVLMLAAVFPSLAFSQELQPIPIEFDGIKEYGYTLERALLKGGMLFFSGAADGVAETIKFHPDQFFAVHPGADRQFWDGRVSWRNKYRNGDPAQGRAYLGSTTWLAWTTDGYHLSRTTGNVFLFGSITISVFEKRRKWWTYPAEFVAGGLVRSAGFHATYSLLYR